MGKFTEILEVIQLFSIDGPLQSVLLLFQSVFIKQDMLNMIESQSNIWYSLGQGLQ